MRCKALLSFGLLCLFFIFSGCTAVYQNVLLTQEKSRAAGDTGLHAAYGTFTQKTPDTITVFADEASYGYSQGMVELPDMIEAPFYAKVDISYLMNTNVSGISIIFPGGNFIVLPDSLFLKDKEDDKDPHKAVARQKNIPNVGVVDKNKNTLSIYHDGKTVTAFINGILADRLTLSGPYSPGRVSFGFAARAGTRIEAEYSNYSVIQGEQATSAYNAQLEQGPALVAELQRKQEEEYQRKLYEAGAEERRLAAERDAERKAIEAQRQAILAEYARNEEKFILNLSANDLKPGKERREGSRLFLLSENSFRQDLIVKTSLAGRPRNGLQYPVTVTIDYTLNIPVEVVMEKMILGIDFVTKDIRTQHITRQYVLETPKSKINDSVKFEVVTAGSAQVFIISAKEKIIGDPELLVQVVEVQDASVQEVSE